MEKQKIWSAKELSKSLARAGGWGAGNGELYWMAARALSEGCPMMGLHRAAAWVELWAARASGCPVALGLRGPRKFGDPFYSPTK